MRPQPSRYDAGRQKLDVGHHPAAPNPNASECGRSLTGPDYSGCRVRGGHRLGKGRGRQFNPDRQHQEIASIIEKAPEKLTVDKSHSSNAWLNAKSLVIGCWILTPTAACQ
jgi:hypothetical protein